MIGTITPRHCDTGERFAIRVSGDDAVRVASIVAEYGRFVDVTDLDSGAEWRIYRRPCSADCFCDARAFPRPRVTTIHA